MSGTTVENNFDPWNSGKPSRRVRGASKEILAELLKAGTGK